VTARLIALSALLIASAALSEQPAQDAATGRLADLAVAQRDYVDVAPAFSPQARRTAHALIAKLRSDAPAMTDAQFALALMRIAALAENGHDNAELGDGAWRPTLRLPVRMIWFPDALVVARAAPEHAELLGATVLAVEGLTPAQLRAKLRPLQGGTDAYRRWQQNWLFHSTEVLHALGLAGRPDALRMRLRLRDGRSVDRTLQARAQEQVPPGQHSARYWMPGTWPGEAEMGWRAAVDAAAAPVYLQQPDEWFRMLEMHELDALYVQFRSNMDEDDARIAPFVAAVADRLRAAPPLNAIVDLRFDTGGDNTQNRDLMREIAQRVRGRIFLLVGNYTFSAGIASAAALAHDGGTKVTIVGSEIADRTYWWSEHAEPVCLPTSRICFPLNSGYWDIVHGCRANKACYGDQFDLRVGTLAPRLRAPLLSKDWLANRDPGLEAIAVDLRRGHLQRDTQPPQTGNTCPTKQFAASEHR
jgi:hypothetical protein